MIPKEIISSLVHKAYAELDEPSARVCHDIIFFLSSHKSGDMQHITYQTIMNGLHKNEVSTLFDNDDLVLHMMRSLDYLTSSKLHILDIHFQFYGPTEDEPSYIEKSELAEAIVSGKFYHPESGEEVEDFRKYIFPFFSPSSYWMSINE